MLFFLKKQLKISHVQSITPDSSWEQCILRTLASALNVLSPAAWSLLILVSSLGYLCLFQAKSRRAKVGQTPSVNLPHATADPCRIFAIRSIYLPGFN